LTETDKISGEDDSDREVQTPYGASTLVDDRVLEVDKGEPSVCETSYEERDIGPVEAAEIRRVDQTESALDTTCPTSLLSLLPNLPASSLPDLGDKDSVMV
jgi:hypothetical protein